LGTCLLRLFTAATGGTLVWQETDTAVAADGLVLMELGSMTAIDPTVLTGIKLFLDLAGRDRPCPYSIRRERRDGAQRGR
jgi:hypothetical protein